MPGQKFTNMKFDAATSKLYQQIMDAAVGFFGLDSATATETDVHAAFDGQKPLAEQLDAARTAAVADLQKQFDDLKSASTANDEKISGFQKQLDDLKSDIATKDNRIAELQKEIADAKLATDNLKVQHRTETEKLAGELAANRAGKTMETEIAGDVHDAAKADKSKTGTPVIVAKSDKLNALLKPAAAN